MVARWLLGVRGAGVWTLSCWNIAATSEAEEDAVTGLGLEMGAMGLRVHRVAKSTIGMGTATGVSTVFVWENGIGESAMALMGYL
jgi:hypothetical protein